MLKKIFKLKFIFLFFAFLFQLNYLFASNYVKGEIIVKYKSAEVSEEQTRTIANASSSTTTAKTKNLSKLNNKFKISSSKQLFKDSQINNKKTRTINSANSNSSSLSNIYVLKFSEEYDAKEVAKEFEKDSNVEYAEPNYEVHAFLTPNDSNFSNQWGLNNTGQTGGTAGAHINALKAWDITTGSSDVVIAVVDTGVDYNHVDLRDNMWTNANEIAGNGIDDDGNGYTDDVKGWDFCNNDNNPIDDHYHGTHCAGIIAGKGNNGIGISGVCWTAKIMPLKFLSSYGSGSTANGAASIIYAVDNGANVISNSWGGGSASSLMHEAIQHAVDNNVVVVFAAGNESTNSPTYPAYYEETIAVAATDHNDEIAYFSNYGTWVDISAPGVNIYSTIPNDQYQNLSGTSMACPMVAGLAGLILSNDPSLTNQEVREAIENFADNIDALNPSYIGQLGAGRINAFASLQNEITITGVDKNKIKQGATSNIRIYGSNFKDGISAVISDFNINSLQRISSREILCNVSVPADSSLGLQNIVLTNPDGKQTTGNNLIEVLSINTGLYNISGYVKTTSFEPVANVEIKLTGDEVRTTTTNANGYYEFLELYEANYIITPIKPGCEISPSSITISLTSDLANQNFELTKLAGYIEWSFDTGYDVASSPAIAPDGTIYVTSGDDDKYIVNALNSDGTRKWQYTINESYMQDPSPCVGDDGSIYIGGSYYDLYALTANGTKKWNKSLSISQSENTNVTLRNGSPAIGFDGTIYAPAYSKLMAVNPANGNVLWEYDIGSRIKSSPAIAPDGTIYVGSSSDKLYAINPNGSLKWSFTAGDWIDSSPAIGSDGTIYVGCWDRKLYALNPTNGTKKWSFSTSGSMYNSSPIIGEDGTIYIGDNSGKLYAINPNGTQKWEYSLAGTIDIAPCIDSNGIIYVGSTNGKFCAINSTTGALVWQITLPAGIESAPVLDNNGMLYIGCSDKKIYAISTASSGPADSPWPMFRNNAKKQGQSFECSITSLNTSKIRQADTIDLYIYGGGFSSGTIVNSINDITINTINYISPAEMKLNISANENANLGKRNITITNTVGKSATAEDILEIISKDINIYNISGYVKTASFEPVANIEINLTGDASKTVTTDANGYYEFLELYEANYIITPTKSNCEISPSSMTISLNSNLENQNFELTKLPGYIEWSFDTGYDVASSPAIADDGTIYITSGDTSKYIVNALNPDGTAKWQYTLNESYMHNGSPCIGEDGTIYIGGSYYDIYALTSNGTKKWNKSLNVSGNENTNVTLRDASVAVGFDGTIYAGGDDRLIAINPANGNVFWEYNTGNRIESSPAIAPDGTIYVGSWSNKLYAINPNGSLKWNFTASNWIDSSPAIGSDGTIYVGCWDRKLYALNPTNGSRKWSFSTTGSMYNSSPIIGEDGTIYIGDNSGKLYAINPTGTKKWEYSVGGTIDLAPCIDSNGIIYVGSTNGKFCAINSATGALVWQITLPAGIESAPVIDNNGMLYIGCSDDKLYAINSLSSSRPADSPWPMFRNNAKKQGQSFEINITSINLDKIRQTDTKDIYIYGAGFSSGTILTNIEGINVNSFEILSSTKVKANISVNEDATLGKRDITLTNAFGRSATLQNALEIISKDIGIYNISGYVKTASFEPVENVQINLTGDEVRTTTTNANGYYEFLELYEANYIITPTKSNCEISPSSMTISLNSNLENQNFELTKLPGYIEWSFDTGYDVASSPAIADDGTIYIGSGDTSKYIVNALNQDGTSKWKYTINASYMYDASPCIDDDGNVYISGIYYVYALTANGTKKWNKSFSVSDESKLNIDVKVSVRTSSVAIGSDGTIYANASYKFMAINPSNSNVLWTYSLSYNCESSPAIGPDGTIYFGCDNSKLYAINPNGTKKWEFTTNSYIDSSPAIGADGTIYFGSWDDNLYAINPNGTKKWNIYLEYLNDSSPIIGEDGTIYIANSYGKLYAINPTGTKKWEYSVGGSIELAPCIDSNGIIYVGSTNKKFCAINSTTGALVWQITLPAATESAPVLDDNGILYIGCSDNKLYAINSLSSSRPANSPWPMFRNNAKKQGQSFEINITSINLDKIRQTDTKDIYIYGGGFSSGTILTNIEGINVNSFQILSSTAVKANISVNEDATLGKRNITLTNAFGRSATLQNTLEIISKDIETYNISGYIKINSSEPVANVQVDLTGDEVRTTTTNANGYYEFSELFEGNYLITPSKTDCVFSPSSIAISTLSANLENQDFELTILELQPNTYNISGYIKINSSEPATNVQVDLTGDEVRTTTTNANGYYEFSELFEGNYLITPSKTDCVFSPSSIAISTLNANLENQDFELTILELQPNTYNISGYIKINSSEPVANVQVDLTGDEVRTTTTNANGYYEFSELYQGNYLITPSKTDCTFSPSSIAISTLSANLENQDFELTILEPDTYNISGYIKINSSEPVANVQVDLTGDEVRTTTSNANGYYEFLELSTGFYTITPLKTDYIFLPDSIIISTLTADLYNQNFIGMALKSSTDILRNIVTEITTNLPSGEIKLKITPNTFTEDIKLEIKSIVPQQTNTPDIKTTTIGLEITNDKNLQPTKPIELVLSYRDSDIVGLDETKLLVMRYVNNNWIPLPSKVDTSAKTITATLNHFSTFVVGMYNSHHTLENVKAYPVPFDPTKNAEGLKIANLTNDNTNVKIYTILGELVNEFKDVTSGYVIWDGKNQRGNVVASGVYLIYIKDDKNKKIVKIAVEK